MGQIHQFQTTPVGTIKVIDVGFYQTLVGTLDRRIIEAAGSDRHPK